MPKKILKKTIKLMQSLYDEGLSVTKIARRAKVSYSAAYGYTKAKEKGFESPSEYVEDLVKKKEFESYSKYLEHLVKKRKFKSFSEYLEYLAKKRQQRPLNQALSNLIKKRLTELNKNQKWLAEQLGVTKGTISRYISGRITPTGSLQKKLFKIIEVEYKTIDDILE